MLFSDVHLTREIKKKELKIHLQVTNRYHNAYFVSGMLNHLEGRRKISRLTMMYKLFNRVVNDARENILLPLDRLYRNGCKESSCITKVTIESATQKS